MMGDSFVDTIVAAAVDASPEIKAAVEQLKAAENARKKEATARHEATAGIVPTCEWLDPKSGPSFNVPYDEEGYQDKAQKILAAEKRIEEIKRQLDTPGAKLTNRKRQALGNERHRWERWLEHEKLNLAGALLAERQRKKRASKLKAQGKKLRWLARKHDAAKEV